MKLSAFYTRIKEYLLLAIKRRSKNILVTKRVEAYLEELHQSSAVGQFKQEYKEISKLSNASYQTPFNEVCFLEIVAKMINAKKVLEIGTFRGLTSLALAKACGEDSAIFTCELNSSNAEAARDLWKHHGYSDRIYLLEGDATESMKRLVSEKKDFDLIYIDADKKQYPTYYKLALNLSHKGSVIVIDNALWAGLVAEPQTSYSHAQIIDKLNRKIFYKHKGNAAMIPAWDGALLILV